MCRLPAYEARLRVRERKHPKLFWVDSGLVRALKRQFGALAPEERGSLLEGWLLTVLRAHAEETDLYDDIFYWSPVQSRQVEVDFLLKRGRELIAIEVKSQPRYSHRLLAGLRAIGELPQVVRRILVYGGERRLKSADGIDVWPIAAFLGALLPRSSVALSAPRHCNVGKGGMGALEIAARLSQLQLDL